MKRYRVRIIDEAEQDITDIYRYVAVHDSAERAEQVLGKLEDLCLSLATMPTRGHMPPELERIGVLDYREVHFKPYRVIYEVLKQDVYIHCVVDGRRDMQSFLQRRLFR